jgi:hypothetical protein
MKDKTLLIFLLLAIIASVFFTYQRSFVRHDFELVNSEEELEAPTLEEEDTEETEVGPSDPLLQ